jgi:hypothetical protein
MLRIAAVVRRVAVMTGGHRVIIFGFLPQFLKREAVAVAFSVSWLEGAVQRGPGGDQAREVLAAFRGEV